MNLPRLLSRALDALSRLRNRVDPPVPQKSGDRVLWRCLRAGQKVVADSGRVLTIEHVAVNDGSVTVTVRWSDLGGVGTLNVALDATTQLF